MPSSATISATDASVSGIAEFRVTADQLASILTTHAATSRYTNLLPPSHRIAGSGIPELCWKAAAMELQIMIGEPGVRIDLLTCDMHAAWAPYPTLNIT